VRDDSALPPVVSSPHAIHRGAQGPGSLDVVAERHRAYHRRYLSTLYSADVDYWSVMTVRGVEVYSVIHRAASGCVPESRLGYERAADGMAPTPYTADEAARAVADEDDHGEDPEGRPYVVRADRWCLRCCRAEAEAETNVPADA
jgi:hypothetical protein